MNRHLRQLTGFVAIAAVLFAQLAVSAFACPIQTAGIVEPMHMAMGDCAGNMGSKESAQPALCHQHCQNDAQNTGDAPQPLVSVALAPSFVANLSLPVFFASGVVKLSPALLHATSPPFAIRNCCFRI